MFDGTTLIVDVLTLGENSYALSLPAEDLWVAYEVVRRHVDANGVRHYSQMTEAKTTTDGYSFKFDTGDTFTCASHLDKPTSSTLSDETGGGSGGLPPVTAADAGKVLTAQASATKGAVIVPEQTVELMGKTPVELTGVTSFPSDGDVVIVVQAQTDTAVTVSHGTIIINSLDEVYSEGGKYYCKSSQASNRGHTFTLTVYASVQTVNTAWEAQQKKFIVTLTPTAVDFSGVMDKTVAEIDAAYKAGQEIVLRVMVSSGVYYDFATTVSYVGAHAYPQHVCMGVVDDKLILFWTATDLPENTTYYTTLYTLTPAT